MRKINFITAIAIAAAILFSACNKTESGDTDVNNDQNQTEVEVTDYTYDESTNTYTVYTATGLLAWNTAAQIDTTLNCTLAADIDMTDIEWTPVGNDTIRYNGTFEGGDHTITGLTINQSGSSNVGMIGYLGSDGRVQNLTLDNASITGYEYVGGVAGSSYGTVTACSVSGSVNGYQRIGGVVGTNSGTVTACYASGSVTGNGCVGGVVGEDYSAYMIACYHASGNISASYNRGGVVGYSNTGSTRIVACYWQNNRTSGIGSGYGSTTEVDNTDVTWQDAVTSMNEAIEEWNISNSNYQCDWEYELLTGNDYPTLTKTN